MELMVCIDGAEAATCELIDGNDPFNNEAERGALDRAYEFKTTNPDSVVSIVLAGDDWGDEVQLDPEPDHVFIAENLALLADIDEGEHTDAERLRALSERLMQGLVTLSEGGENEGETGTKLGIHLLATPKPLPLGQWHTKHADDCPVTRHRDELLDDIDVERKSGSEDSGRMAYLLGAVPEYDLGGDQEIELCTCGTAGRIGGAA